IATGAGDDTIIMPGANDTVDGGLGNNQILTGAGNDVINTRGNDFIAFGATGAATINAFANNPAIFLSPGSSVFNGGSGHATVLGFLSGTPGSHLGSATMNSAGNGQLWLGEGQTVVNSTGADTILARSGAATVN